MSHEANDFIFRPAEAREVEEVTHFYNDVIEYSRSHPNRTLYWEPYTDEGVKKIVDRQGVYIITPERADSKLPKICAAVMFDEDRDAWPEQEGILPPRALRFAKFAVHKVLTGTGFGRNVVWPQMLEYAKDQGYQSLYCEAHKEVEQLDDYYKSLGMVAHGALRYRSPYYNKVIEAHRYSILVNP